MVWNENHRIIWFRQSNPGAEEQIIGAADHGGIQIVIYPMKREVFEKRFPKKEYEDRLRYQDLDEEVCFSLEAPCGADMGLAPGGRMRQEIYEDPFKLSDWDLDNKSRCFVHLANSLVWRAITGDQPPSVPFTAKEYNDHGLPWFDYYSDNSTALKGSGKLKATAMKGSGKLKGLKSVAEMGKEKGDNPLPENESIAADNIVKLRKGLKKGQVREGQF
jgi:hypothetical protein